MQTYRLTDGQTYKVETTGVPAGSRGPKITGTVRTRTMLVRKIYLHVADTRFEEKV